MKIFSKVMSLIVMRLCGSISHYGVCTVFCAEHSTQYTHLTGTCCHTTA